MNYKMSAYSQWVRNTSSPSEFTPGKERSSGEVYNFIGGGKDNTVSASQYSSILGGYNNTVASTYSSIFGGSGNNDGGFSHAGIFGCNVTANSSCAFHANNFVAQNMPSASSGIPGSLWYNPTNNAVYRTP